MSSLIGIVARVFFKRISNNIKRVSSLRHSMKVGNFILSKVISVFSNIYSLSQKVEKNAAYTKVVNAAYTMVVLQTPLKPCNKMTCIPFTLYSRKLINILQWVYNPHISFIALMHTLLDTMEL